MDYYVTYVRVSTDKQDESGLGLEAQRSAIHRYLKERPHVVLAEFQEVDSGGNNNRVELAKAVKLCKSKDAILIFAKLDRLGRDASYLHELRNTIKILDVEMPENSTLLFSVRAGLAEEERMRISGRTKAALKAKRERDGSWVNNPKGIGAHKAAKASVKSRKEMALMNEDSRRALGFINALVKKGLSWDEIADELNYWRFRSAQGRPFNRGMAYSLWTRRFSFDYYKSYAKNRD